jgi:anti-sigma-K factor RskA
MTMNRHDSIGAMLDEYALGRLSQAERRDVESHVRECDACAADLRDLHVVMEGLARSVEPVAPPPALKQRVLASLAAQPQEPRRTVSGTIAGATTIITGSESAADVRRGVHAGWLAAAAVAILGLAAALYFSNLSRGSLIDDVEQARADAAAARAAAAEAQATAAEVRRELGQYTAQADLALSILTSSDMRPVRMAGRENATGSTARAYWSATRGLLIVANDLPVPPPGRIYQVWIIPEKAQPISAGLLGERGSGRGMLIVPPPSGAAAGPVTVAVTDEPPGGLAAPSGTIRLAGSI